MALARRLRIAICHPDLGIGGAERLVVDAALELKAHGHDVHVFTAYHDPKRCFEETADGSFPVTVYGSFVPRHIFYKLHALFAYLRCIIVAVAMIMFWPAFDVVLVDQVSVAIPILKLKRSSKVLFYCHFPDMLLAHHDTILRKLYRGPIDWLEETTTGMADGVLVNSEFTAVTFYKTFRKLEARGICPSVLYPAVDVEQFIFPSKTAEIEGLSSGARVFLSINRFERKKNIGLAISAFALLLKHCESEAASDLERSIGKELKLVVAGGFDKRLAENRDYLAELQMLASENRIDQHVMFVPSCSSSQRNALLGTCLAVVYTPLNEHFGIVPLEGMAAGKPVIACNSGGPKESIVQSRTGFLCEAVPQSFASAMSFLLKNPEEAQKMGRAAREHVQRNFSRQVFGIKLNEIILQVNSLSKSVIQMTSLDHDSLS